MSQTAIPLEFERYLQNKMSVGEAPDMNQMIFAYIPDLDLGVPIDREDGLPDVSTWVHEQDVDQVGKLGDNALAYSVVIQSDVPAFTFNAIFLRDKNVQNSCGVAVYKIDETKEAGMSSTKSLLQSYTGAASIAGITVDASTWQIDYQARLFGIEADQRLVNLDYYGHTAFISGFNVTQEDDPTKYTISAGVVYLGGLRAELDSDELQTIITKPNTIYVDVYRAGTVLSAWENTVSIVTSENELEDYVDNGQQHYVAKIATIDADGNITDARVSGGISAAFASRTISTTFPLSGGGDLSGDLTLEVDSAALVPAGVPIPWPTETVPTGFFECNGADFDTDTYTELAEAYPDGALPDLRGEFIRGWDNGREVDTDREILSSQSDAIRNITGSLSVTSYLNNASNYAKNAFSSSDVTYSVTENGASGGTTYDPTYIANFDASNEVPTADENRPRNIAFMYIVRAA